MLRGSEMAVPISQYSEEGQPCEPAVDLPGRRATASAREGENADVRVAGRVPICSTCELAANLTRRRAARRGDRGEAGHAEPLSRDGCVGRTKTTSGCYRAGEPISVRQDREVGKHL